MKTISLFLTVFLSFSLAYADGIHADDIQANDSQGKAKPRMIMPRMTMPRQAIMANKAAAYLLTDMSHNGQYLVAVGKWGNILLSDPLSNNTSNPASNPAADWRQASVPVQVLLTAVFFINQKTGWAVGHDATILVTHDGGLNWQIQQYQPALDKPLLDIHFFDAEHGIAAGAYGLFYRTLDGGKTWHKEFAASLLYPEDVDYLAELKDTDPEGYRIEAEFILPHFNGLYDADDALYMVGELGLIAKSVDQGKTWQRLDEIYPGSFFAIAQLANKRLVVGGLRGHIFVSDDQGLSWQQIHTDSNASINSITVDNNTAYLSANNGVIFTLNNNAIEKFVESNGKAILASVKQGSTLMLATEAGIHQRVVHE